MYPWRVRILRIALCTVASSSTTRIVSPPPTPGSATPTAARLAVVLFTLPGAGTLDVTPTMARDTYFGATNSVAQFYRDASDNAFTLSGTVVGPYALANVDVSVLYGGWWLVAGKQEMCSAASTRLNGPFGRMTKSLMHSTMRPRNDSFMSG